MRAIVAQQKKQPAVLTEIAPPGPLGEDEVLIEVSHSSVNYKDGATVVGRPGFVRSWPLAVGIDAVGTVAESTSARFAPGDRVVLNGGGAGESRPGGFAERTVARAASLVHVPDALSTMQAASIGTAGFTAALAVLALEDRGISPDDGDVLVTGAAGGVGSVAISLLAGRGHRVVASTGRADAEGEYLRGLGAAELLDRRELAEPSSAPLQSARWAAVVDGVGSSTLANALAQTRYGGVAAAYGLAQGSDLPTTVLPFILRAVSLVGVNSVDAPTALRERAWALLGAELDLSALETMTEIVGLEGVLEVAPRILEGRIRGRTVVDVRA